MPDLRRVVPDTSVMLPGFFPEELSIRGKPFDVTRYSLLLVTAIRSRAVVSFASSQLLHEFMNRAHQKAYGRDEPNKVPRELVGATVEDFLRLPMTYVPALPEIAHAAWHYAEALHISVADSWFLACAIQYDAELWLSHEHEDGFVAKARNVHEKVFTLVERKFS